MTKLHELIAVEPDLKAAAERERARVTSLFREGTVRLKGQVKTYTPLEEQGEKFSPEVAILATTVPAELDAFAQAFTGWVDASVQKEVTNTLTEAAVTLDGKEITAKLPAPALLNLESKLAAIKDLYESIPTLDPTEQWNVDLQNADRYVSAPAETYRTQKVQDFVTVAEATDRHPAQVQAVTTDRRAGVWTLVKHSGMLSETQKRVRLARLDKLIRAVKEARQRANDTSADTNLKIGQVLFRYIEEG